jgi:hypothetical protein
LSKERRLEDRWDRQICRTIVSGREVPHMSRGRLDVRLDEEHRRKLNQLAAARGVPVSRVVRELIDRAHEDVQRLTRLRAAEELCRLEVSDVPDPGHLSQLLNDAHAIPDPYRR